jgi:hypothetical protein
LFLNAFLRPEAAILGYTFLQSRFSQDGDLGKIRFRLLDLLLSEEVNDHSRACTVVEQATSGNPHTLQVAF